MEDSTSLPTSDVDEPWTQSRTLPAIILGCLFSLFTCVWCCSRPDFPSPYDSKLRILSTKLNIVFWVLVCPEAILFWAMRQWFEAGKVGREFQDRGWTRRHALFVLMGGFVICKDGQPVQTLSIPHFKHLLERGAIDFPSITIPEIQEHSNSHPILLLLTLLQGAWLVIQCISRIASGLFITQLEAMSATLVLATACILFFVWQKPLDARYPILINPIVNLETLHDADRVPQGLSVKRDFSREHKLAQTVQRIFQLESAPAPPQHTPIGQLIVRYFIFIAFWPMKSLHRDITQLSMTQNASDLPEGALKVPLFFVQDTMDTRVLLLPVTALGMFVSLVSYLLLWYGVAPFPSETAESVWRVGSVTSTAFSGVMFGLIIIVNFLYLLSRPPFSFAVAEVISDVFLFIVLCTFFLGFATFVLARIMLLLVSFASLRSLPPGAFEINSWTNYIPHFP